MITCPICNDGHTRNARGHSIHMARQHRILSDNPKTALNRRTNPPKHTEHRPEPGYIGVAIAVIEQARRDNDPWLQEIVS